MVFHEKWKNVFIEHDIDKERQTFFLSNYTLDFVFVRIAEIFYYDRYWSSLWHEFQTNFRNLFIWHLCFLNQQNLFSISNQSIIFIKVHVFWEGHKILRNLLLTVYTVVKNKVKISQNLVAFSEYMNFGIKGSYLFQTLTI